jgi:hypothetical protein
MNYCYVFDPYSLRETEFETVYGNLIFITWLYVTEIGIVLSSEDSKIADVYYNTYS